MVVLLTNLVELKIKLHISIAIEPIQSNITLTIIIVPAKKGNLINLFCITSLSSAPGYHL